MKTYPLLSDTEEFIGFEISNTWIHPKRIVKLLRNNLKLESVENQKFFSSSDIRIEFRYKNQNYIIFEPFGDSSRYWVGLLALDKKKVYDYSDMKDIENVFINHRLFSFF